MTAAGELAARRHAETPGAGAELLDELAGTLKHYVVLPDEHAAVAVTLWIATTHALPAFECAPRLVATSPDKRCGKTRLLDIVAGTCHRPLMSVNATVAAIFRSIDGNHPPTLILDEADTVFGNKKTAEQHEDLRALLNAGHQRGRPALRCVGANQVPTEFNTFCMVALAGIGAMPDTITDRAINITMRRRASGEKVAQFRSRRDGPALERLRRRLAGWAAQIAPELSNAVPDMPVEDRAADTWEPLVAVADAAGGHWPATARAACVALVGEADAADGDSSPAVRLLEDIRQVFHEKGVTFLPSQELLTELRDLEDSPWGDFGLTPSKLARCLKGFEIRPGRNPTASARGYRLEDFADAFERYTRQKVSEPVNRQVSNGFLSDGSDSQGVKVSEGVRCPEPSTSTSDALTASDGCSAHQDRVPPSPPSAAGGPTDRTPGYTARVHKELANARNGQKPATETANLARDGNGREPICPGCGLYRNVHGRHRDDCTLEVR